MKQKSVNEEGGESEGVNSLQLIKEEMAPHSSTPAWKIPWTEEPGELQSMGSQKSQT